MGWSCHKVKQCADSETKHGEEALKVPTKVVTVEYAIERLGLVSL